MNNDKLPPEHYPQRTCRCTDCPNTIPGHTMCYRVNGRNVCQFCGLGYRFNLLMQAWTKKQGAAK